MSAALLWEANVSRWVRNTLFAGCPELRKQQRHPAGAPLLARSTPFTPSESGISRRFLTDPDGFKSLHFNLQVFPVCFDTYKLPSYAELLPALSRPPAKPSNVSGSKLKTH